MKASNNFDLIRLLAATQVALVHILRHSGFEVPEEATYFPGVPIFFFISGYLIDGALARNGNLWDYLRNRALRLYPGLATATLASTLFMAAAGYFSIKWIAGQLTFFQWWVPYGMGGYGLGNPNGALWSIAIELQFYLIAPLVFANQRFVPYALAFFLAMNVAIMATYDGFHVILMTYLPWVYMFLTGAYLRQNKALRASILRLPGYVFAMLIAWVFVSSHWLPTDNWITPLQFIPMALVVLKAAYSAPGLADRLLRRNDYSYGIYIFHIPILSVFYHAGWSGWPLAAVAVPLTIFIAVASWRYIERPALRLKRQTSYRHQKTLGNFGF